MRGKTPFASCVPADSRRCTPKQPASQACLSLAEMGVASHLPWVSRPGSPALWSPEGGLLCGTETICANSHTRRWDGEPARVQIRHRAKMAGHEITSRWCPRGSRGCICPSKSCSRQGSPPSAIISNVRCPVGGHRGNRTLPDVHCPRHRVCFSHSGSCDQPHFQRDAPCVPRPNLCRP
jgi:hypothetical protein